jgi:choline kinase
MEHLPAIILAAGKGERLGEITDRIPKPMVEVNGIKIIDNLINALLANHIKQIIVVTGYLHDELAKNLQQFKEKVDLQIIENEIYATTNNIYSLWKAEKYLRNGFFLFEADIFFDNLILKKLVNSPQENIILVGKFDPRMDGTVVQLAENSNVTKMFLKRHQSANFDFSDKYKTVNFYKIGSQFTRKFFHAKLRSHINRGDLNSYYELIFEEALKENWQFYGMDAGELKWWEIDTQEDLKYCELMFS